MKNKKKLFFITIFILIVAVTIGLCYSLFVGPHTLSEVAHSNEVWDGVTVSNYFSAGNGTVDNPYQIRNGADLAYFKKIIEEDNSANYSSKYYVLEENIDMGSNSFSTIGNENNYFRGHLDGKGHTIINLNINGFIDVDSNEYYGIFYKTDNAIIENINFYNYNVTTNTSNNNAFVASLICNAFNTKISNISFQNSKYNFNNISTNNNIGGLVTNLGEGSSINNIALNMIVDSPTVMNIGTISYEINSKEEDAISNGIVDFKYNNLIVNNNSLYILNNTNVLFKNIYCYDNENNLVLDNNTVTSEDVLNSFNNNNNYLWVYEDNVYKFKEKEDSALVYNNDINKSNSKVVMRATRSIPVNNSGVVDNYVYVNDLESDYNYYKGLNYTYGEDDGLLPTGENQNLYNDNNLVKVYIDYSGADYNDSSKVGYVSIDEQQNHYVYYKYYPVVNGYVNITLIDNPFTDRPNDLAFNGWVTDYQGANISYDSNYYTRSVSIPVTYTNSVPDTIEIVFNANWVEATAVDLTSTRSNGWSNAFSGLNSAGMKEINVSEKVGQLSSGYYKLRTISRGNSYSGLYDSNGNYMSTGTCNSTSCSYYELIQFYDGENNIQVFNNSDRYYYLVTRDTNIIVLKANNSYTWGSSQNKPFTLTGVYNGVDYRDSYYWNVSYIAVKCYNDTVIENIRIRNSQSTSSREVTVNSGTSNRGYFYGNWQNAKIGRGIINYSNNTVTFTNVLGGGNNSSGNSVVKYTFNIESGIYNSGSLTQGAVGTSYDNYVEARGIYGNDYDRILNNNDDLIFYSCLSGSWGGDIYASTNEGIALDSTYKSGQYGYNKYDNIQGIYVGGRQGGSHNASRKGTIEGGWFYNVIGGPLTNSNRASINDTYIYIKGGSINVVTAGAGQTATYGNRIVQMTGGLIENSLFGGSNAHSSGDGYGTLNGSSFIYVGGNSIVGREDYVNNNTTFYNAESGSVFGNGHGNSGYSSVGSNDNANIIIADSALIRNNVYGGGNFGATGVSSDYNTNTTNINIMGGTINGSLYGGGNNNGSGSNTKKSTINITMTNGTINGSIYGGSRNKGTIYGSTNINVIGGYIKDSIYGGGKGGYENSSSPGTFVLENVNLILGNTDINSTPTINGSVYGGSEFGTVNGSSNSDNVSNNSVNITVNKAIINEAIYGGGKGSNTFYPYVLGNVNLIVNDGNIGHLYGGNDIAGITNGKIEIKLNGGIIGDIYGGGNKASIKETNIYLEGATVNDIYGGSNESGSVDNSNIFIKRGSANNIYGGNSIGGSTISTYIEINSEIIYTHKYQATLNGTIYGGGKLTDSTSSKIVLNNVDLNTSVYGGGENGSVDNTEVVANASNVVDIYGGSNKSGDVKTSSITINKGEYESIYGGNNQGGNTKETNIVHNGGLTTNIYGGGNQTTSGVTNVLINDGIVANLYGGGNQAGVDTTNVDIKSGSVFNAYGGSNQSGTIKKSNIKTSGNSVVNDSDIVFDVTYDAVDTTWQSTEYPTIVTINYNITNNSSTPLTTWNASVYVENSKLFSNYSQSEIMEDDSFYSINEVNRYWGTNEIAPGASYTITFDVLTMQKKEDFKLSYGLIGTDGESQFASGSSTMIGNLYGGNDDGGYTEETNVIINDGFTGDIYGGGDIASVGTTSVTINGGKINSVYGGANRSSVDNDTKVVTTGGEIITDIYGGGNEGVVLGSTDVNVLNTQVNGSVYAGGKGVTAPVSKNTVVTIQGNTVIGTDTSKIPEEGCLFGSGKAAATGSNTTNNSSSIVNIVGGTIKGNVYGGANTSVVYGKSNVNIGTNSVDKDNLEENNINILGTIFGGGEANASGSEEYDFSFISVTKEININIDGKDYLENNHTFNISGSLFGSGNASSSSGTSEINIKNLGTKSSPSRNISIQRSDVVVVDKSYIELSGATDRTNEYSTIEYSFNRVDLLKIKNNSTILLEKNANLLKEVQSLVDIDGREEKAAVTFDKDNKKTIRNVDNRIYMMLDRNLNITTNESATAYGKISGMTFFGMYTKYNNGVMAYGLYDNKLDYGSKADASDALISGSYILGLHNLNQDYTIDGFYTNELNDDYTEIVSKYIEPTPKEAEYYMWTIGAQSINYSFTLTASKYSSLGTYELSMLDFADGDTIFEVLGFNTDALAPNISLVDSNEVPKVADSSVEANSILGLSMKSETTEWTNAGTTKLLSKDNGTYTGCNSYKTDSQSTAPSLMFYLYHAKDISLDQELGTVVVSLQALVPKNEIEYDVQLITITIDLVAKSYADGDSYDASITYDKKYEMPSATNVNITNKSQFTAYYSLYAEPSSFNAFYGNNNDYYHVLTTSYALPVGTVITMLDYGGDTNIPTYYYFEVDQNCYNKALQELQTYNEVTYKLSDFVIMGSSSKNNKYKDSEANKKYFKDGYYNYIVNQHISNKVMEEFIFIFDFKNTDIVGNYLNNEILFELRNKDDRAVLSVLGIRQQLMRYSLYEASNVVLNEEVNLSDTNIYRNTYSNILYSTKISYDQNESRQSIIDTNYESRSMGLNISFYDSSNNKVSSSSLMGTTIRLNGVSYYVDSDGIFRIKLADKVSNINRNITLKTDSTLPSGSYTLRFTLFASNDGIHNDSTLKETTVDVPIIVVNNDNTLQVESDDKTKVINKETLQNMLGNNTNQYIVNYKSNLSNPNLRLSILKRNTTSSIDNTYTEIPVSDLFLLTPLEYSNNLSSQTDNEILLSRSLKNKNEFNFKLNESISTGTYKLVFKLYDQNHFVDEDIEYVIVKNNY